MYISVSPRISSKCPEITFLDCNLNLIGFLLWSMSALHSFISLFYMGLIDISTYILCYISRSALSWKHWGPYSKEKKFQGEMWSDVQPQARSICSTDLWVNGRLSWHSSCQQQQKYLGCIFKINWTRYSSWGYHRMRKISKISFPIIALESEITECYQRDEIKIPGHQKD